MHKSRYCGINIIVKLYISLLIICSPYIGYLNLGIFEKSLTVCWVLLSSCLIFIYALLCSNNKARRFSKIDLWIGCLGLYELIRVLFGEDINSIFFYECISLGYIYILCRIVNCSYVITLSLIVSGLIQSTLVLLQHAFVLEGNHSLFRMTGSFFNPGLSGGFLAVVFVIVVLLSIRYFRQDKILVGVGLFFITGYIGYALFLSNSRAAWVAALLSIVISAKEVPGFRFLFVKKWWNIVLVSILVVTLGVGLFLYKQNSAIGRIFVWRVSWNIVKEKPLFGHGIDSFREQYMLCQAEYFEENPNSSFVNVAADVEYAYNELLKILVECGIVGLGLFIVVLFLLLYTPFYDILQGGVLALVIFSLFSYPFEVYIFRLVFIVLCASVRKNTIIIEITKYVYWGLLMISLYIGCQSVGLLVHYNRIKECICSNEFCLTSMIESQYYEILSRDPVFMSWYAKQVYLKLSSKDILPILLDAVRLYPCVDIYCDLGKTFENLHENDKAESYYRKASYMVPLRIRPRWELFNLYFQQQKVSQAKEIARNILARPSKVENTVSIRIKAYLEIFLKNNE